MAPRVCIAGAGIGGLALAHALRRRGLDHVIYDRDAGVDDTAGYRLHLTPEAFAALAAVLPPDSIDALRECGSGNDAFTRFAVLDHRGHTRLRLPMTHTGDVLMIGRRPLRRILARGLEVRWSSPVRGFDASPSGVRLDDGAEFDLLVAADGTGSRIAERWVGRPTARPAGVIGIAGRAPLPQRVPADLRHGLAFAIGPGGIGAFFSMDTAQAPPAARTGAAQGPTAAGSRAAPGPPAVRERDPAAEPPSVVWAIAAAAADIHDTSSAGLIAEVHRLTPAWSDDFHALVDRSAPSEVAAFQYYLPAALEPWPSGPVTMLGDAIHPMPPTGGAGASTAILDAVHLANDLAEHPLADALAAYRARLLTYAPAAVAEALPALAWQRRLRNPLLFAAATEIAFPLANAILRARRGY